jgi:pre-mRNA-splicing factor CDC5/CEF1
MFKQRMTADAAKAAKQEKKLGTVLGGYQARFKTLSSKLASVYEQVDESLLALDNFRILAHSEQAAIPRRIEILTKEVRDLERREREGQIKYSEMSREKAELEQRVSELEMDYAEAVNEHALGAMDES